jgi:parallel beta-helix repeat protein
MDKKVGIKLFFGAICAIGALVLTSGVVCAADIFVGPGETYTSIQSAVTAANPFDTITVRDGIYTENIDVTVDNVTIRSENGSANCVVNASASSDHVFEVTADYVNISGFTVQNATGTGKAGIYLNHVDHCTISENTASNNYCGIYLSSSSTNTLTGNTANSNGYYGIYLHSSSTNTLTGNTANSNNNIAGILLSSSSTNTLTNNTVSNNIAGIFLYTGSNDNNLTGNTANSNGYYGIYLYTGSNNNNLTGNTANSNNYHGIFLDSSSTNTLTGNTANSNSIYGIHLSSSSNNNNISGNTASNNAYGIGLHSSSTNTLTDNTANSNNNYGIYLSSSSTNNLTGNIANSNGYYGIYLYTGSNNNLAGNTASNNYAGIWLSSSSNNDITGNTANSNNAYGIIIESSSTNYLTDNTANSNGFYGIWLDSSSTNYLTGNTVSNNYDGIILQFSSNNNLTGNTANSNNYHGISLHSSSNNHIYNNYFNNTQNAYDNGNNVWNITKTPGKNIIGGSWLGGNYWSDYNGNDADGDGLGDTPYDIPGGANKDYLPLVAIAAPHIFDTGKGDYPSIMGTHNGTIKLNQTINVSKLYTYPCIGTGGHTESIELYENDTLIANGTWNGYNGDYSNITLHNATDAFSYVMLLKDHVYNYTIRTGSYPQIIHEREFNATGGTITCTEFTDANGRTYNNWIPAIRLWAD